MGTKSYIHQIIEEAPLNHDDIVTLGWVIIDFHYLAPLGKGELLDWTIPDDLYLGNINLTTDDGKPYLHVLLDAKPFTEEELQRLAVLIRYFYLLSPVAIFERSHLLPASSVRYLNNLSVAYKQEESQS